MTFVGPIGALWRGLVGFALALALTGCLGDGGVGDIVVDSRPNEAWLRGNETEREAWDALGAGKAIRARELAEKALVESPGSFMGTWVLARVMYAEEGNHARARFLYARARAMLEKRFGAEPQEQLAREWHKRVIEAQSNVAGEMEDRVEQLALIAQHDKLYAPSIKSNAIWAYMKLGRFDEALNLANSLLYSEDTYERISAYNGMMAIYDEMRDKTQSYEWGVKGVEVTQGQFCILLHNTAQSGLQLFKFKEVEDYARRSIRAPINDCPGSAYEHLMTLYMALGEFQKAISAYKKVMSGHIEPRYRPMFDKNNKALLAELLFELGKYEEAREYAKIVFAAPDRVGMVSLSEEDIRFAHGILYWMVLDARIRELRQEASVKSFGDRLAVNWDLKELELKQWEVKRILSALSVHKDLLVVNLRPFMRGIKPWYAGAMARIFGAGIATAALAEARELDSTHLDAAGMAFFDAVEAEYALVAGDYERAQTLGRSALAVLVPEHAVLIARLQGVLVAANRELSDGTDDEETVGYVKAIMQRFPMIFHYLDLKMKVSVEHDGKGLSETVAALFHSHSRFETSSDAAFTVTVASPSDTRIEVCLRSRDGFRFACKETTFDEITPETAVDTVNAFVREIFSPRVELTSSDVNSLDGSPVRQSADDALKSILKTKVIKEEDE